MKAYALVGPHELVAHENGTLYLRNEVDKRIAELEQHNERFEQALRRIKQWSEAYPLDVFPEPDWKLAAAVLERAGMTLDSISASNMRHVVTCVGAIARSALEAK